MDTYNVCMHCLTEGYWDDEDKCPGCAEKGHQSPWDVGQCMACNAEYKDKMNDLYKKMGMTLPSYVSYDEWKFLCKKYPTLQASLTKFREKK